ncbi:APC family permease [Loigolactobacillus rennini]|uniref:Amino acid permease family protein n=2 Tax=Loigolactobacillus rennini TaxID=238013 RepID=A0A0R2DIM5_9LACO|nr:amino acid permease [Loigolactobacillus rennini]KRM99884.1 amino acid permease family protein [Loigolactobacillus rennini DSM 20253]SFZ87150.1 amino acid permease family protein [Loigolactobacillus rennini]
MSHHSLFAKKPIDISQFKKGGLERQLTAFSLTAMGVGAVVGAGIFITPGIIAANYAGPGAMLSYILAAAVCALAALCYSEFASTIPLAGSAYTYVYTVFGELLAWILGWALVSEYLFAVASVAVSWSAYFQNLLSGFGLTIPAFFSQAYNQGSGGIDIIAGLITLLIGYLLARGLKESTRVNSIMVIIKVAVILIFLAVAIFYVKPANYKPFLPYGAGGILSGAALAFYAYIGFDAVSTASEEVINPKRDMPIGIISSLGIASLLYAAVAAVLVGVVHYTKLNVGDPVAYALKLMNQNWVAGIVALGAVVGMTTVLLIMSYGGTRLIFAVSRDGLLPKVLSKVSPKTHVPVINTWIFAVVASTFATLIPLDKITELVNIGTLFAFSLVSLGVVFLRRLPDYHKLPQGFKVPFYPVIPLLSCFMCVLLMIQLQKVTWIVFFIWMTLGLLIYATYSYRHSRLKQTKS